MLERRTEARAEERRENRSKTGRLAERDECEPARGRADREQVARAEPFRRQAHGRLEYRGRRAPSRTDDADLDERQPKRLLQYRQQHVTHVGQAVVQNVCGAAG